MDFNRKMKVFVNARQGQHNNLDIAGLCCLTAIIPQAFQVAARWSLWWFILYLELDILTKNFNQEA